MKGLRMNEAQRVAKGEQASQQRSGEAASMADHPLEELDRMDASSAFSAKMVHSGDTKQSDRGSQCDERRISLAEAQLNRWIEAMERLRLADYLRYVEDRRKLFWSSFWSGVARGVGMAIGFTILGAMLILILQDLARHNLPLIGELLDEIMDVVQNGMK